MDIDVADIKPSLWTLVLFAIYLLIVNAILKFAFTKWHVPGLSDLVAAL